MKNALFLLLIILSELTNAQYPSYNAKKYASEYSNEKNTQVTVTMPYGGRNMQSFGFPIIRVNGNKISAHNISEGSRYGTKKKEPLNLSVNDKIGKKKLKSIGAELPLSNFWVFCETKEKVGKDKVLGLEVREFSATKGMHLQDFRIFDLKLNSFPKRSDFKWALSPKNDMLVALIEHPFNNEKIKIAVVESRSKKILYTKLLDIQGGEIKYRNIVVNVDDEGRSFVVISDKLKGKNFRTQILELSNVGEVKKHQLKEPSFALDIKYSAGFYAWNGQKQNWNGALMGLLSNKKTRAIKGYYIIQYSNGGESSLKEVIFDTAEKQSYTNSGNEWHSYFGGFTNLHLADMAVSKNGLTYLINPVEYVQMFDTIKGVKEYIYDFKSLHLVRLNNKGDQEWEQLIGAPKKFKSSASNIHLNTMPRLYDSYNKKNVFVMRVAADYTAPMRGKTLNGAYMSENDPVIRKSGYTMLITQFDYNGKFIKKEGDAYHEINGKQVAGREIVLGKTDKFNKGMFFTPSATILELNTTYVNGLNMFIYYTRADKKLKDYYIQQIECE